MNGLKLKSKNVLAILFVGIILVGAVKNDLVSQITGVSGYLKQTCDPDKSYSVAGLDAGFSATMYQTDRFIDLNGMVKSVLNTQGIYSDMNMYVTDDKYIVSRSNYTSTDYEYNELISFYDFLDANDIRMLYVNEPNKYTDDSIFEEFGVESFSNRNADAFLSRIQEYGVPTLDLREDIANEGLNVEDMFYRTDHHWTTKSGLWASRKMVESLNTLGGYDIDESLYNEDDFEYTEFEDCWLGEQGRKYGQTYVGLDDFTVIKPKYETSYTFHTADGDVEGTFDNYINTGVYNTDVSVYSNQSWHYSYNRYNCINNNVSEGKVLVLGDSYDYVTVPFISLGVHETDFIVLREVDSSFDLRSYIVNQGYDTVIVSYAQFMIGAHDDEDSANYRMFTFE